MSKKSKKTGEITKKRAKNGRFSPNARLNGHARFKTGDLGTLAEYTDAILQARCNDISNIANISKDKMLLKRA